VSNADDTLPPSGSSLGQAFESLVTTLHDRGVRYAIIGGIATIQYTRIRTTDDIDVLLVIPQLAMPSLFEALRARGFALDVMQCIREFRQGLTTVRYRDVVVDLMPPILPVYAHVLDRAVDARVLGQNVRVSSVEGLIVTKLIAMRPQDQLDIRDLISASGASLDVDFIRRELASFTDDTDPRRTTFETWFQQAVRVPPTTNG
jgi:predicted nucleotidyltransferase